MASVPSELDFIEEAVKFFFNNDTLRVLDVKSGAVGAKGDNYMSEVTRIYVKYISPEDHENNITLINKKMFKIDDESLKLMVEKSFCNETRAMSGPLKSMLQITGSIVTPRLLYSRLEDSPFIIMEDLTPRQFTMADRLTGLDLVHASLAIRSLARFHANSVAVCEESPEYSQLYRHSMFGHGGSSTGRFIGFGLNSLAAEIATWEELGPRYSKKLKNLSTFAAKKLMNAYTPRDNEFHVLNHGDFNQLNILFKYNEKTPVECAFVDFQFSNYNSLGIDLQYFMATSIAYDLYDNHRYLLLEQYQLELSRAMMSLNCQTAVPSFKDITKFYDDKNFVNLIATCLIEPVIHERPSDVTNVVDKITEAASTYSRQNRTEDYRKMLSGRLKEFEKLGLFEE